MSATDPVTAANAAVEETRRSTARSVLEVDNASVAYRGVKAVSNVTLTARQGEVLGVIGPNGAGKTTLINFVAGMVRGTGHVRLDASSLISRPHERARAGLGRTFQTPQLFRSLTVAESLRLAARRGAIGNGSARGRRAAGAETADIGDALEAVDLTHRRNSYIGSLPAGEQKLLELAQAFAMRPRALIVDEPAAGVRRQDRDRIVEALRTYVVDHDATCLLVEHDMDLIRRATDWLYVMVDGRILLEGTWNKIREHPEVRKAYLGVQSHEPQDTE